MSLLFFTATEQFLDNYLPSEIDPAQDLLTLCNSTLPDLPDSSLAVESSSSHFGTNYSYCTVETDRGWFRSQSVVSGPRQRFSESVHVCVLYVCVCVYAVFWFRERVSVCVCVLMCVYLFPVHYDDILDGLILVGQTLCNFTTFKINLVDMSKYGEP